MDHSFKAWLICNNFTCIVHCYLLRLWVLAPWYGVHCKLWATRWIITFSYVLFIIIFLASKDVNAYVMIENTLKNINLFWRRHIYNPSPPLACPHPLPLSVSRHTYAHWHTHVCSCTHTCMCVCAHIHTHIQKPLVIGKQNLVIKYCHWSL